MNEVMVLDWGIGGLPALSLLRQRAPSLSLCYVSDAGYTPYGTVPAAELGARLEGLCAELRPSALLVACNAASSVLDARLKLPNVTIGVIDAGVEATLMALEARVSAGVRRPVAGVIGGCATIRSGRYEALIRQRWAQAAPLTIRSEPAQPLSAHVEAGRLNGQALKTDLDELVARLGELDTLTLACTHYPALAGELQARLPHTTLIDPRELFIEQALDALRGHGLLPDRGQGRGATTTIRTTGDPETLEAHAYKVWGLRLPVRPARLTVPTR